MRKRRVDRFARSSGLSLRAGIHQHAHDVAFLHDQELNAVDLDLGARPFTEQHPIAGLDVDGNELAGFVASSRANRNDLALLRLLLGGVGNNDAAGALLLGFDALDDHAVVKRTEFHCSPPKLLTLRWCRKNWPLIGRSLPGHRLRPRWVNFWLQGVGEKNWHSTEVRTNALASL